MPTRAWPESNDMGRRSDGRRSGMVAAAGYRRRHCNGSFGRFRVVMVVCLALVLALVQVQVQVPVLHARRAKGSLSCSEI